MPEKSLAASAGFRTIADLARGRWRKALNRANENADTKLTSYGDHGFRFFKLTDSNIRRWTGIGTKDADTYVAQLEAFADTLVDGWKSENVIWEGALREGFALTSQIEKHEVEGQTFWCVTDAGREQSFHICLDDTLSVEAVRALGLTRENLFVCRDKALDDTLAANLALQCRLKVL